MYYDELLLLEDKYDVEKITINNIQVWPIVRIILYNFTKEQQTTNSYTPPKFNKNNNFSIKETNYLGFSTSKKNDDDTILQPFLDNIFQKNEYSILYDNHNDETNLNHIKSLAKQLQQSISYNFVIENESILNSILDELDININYREKLHNYYFYYLAAKKVLSTAKPKMIFISCYICFLNVIQAAKELQIPVVEIQHGIIIEHFAYNINKNYHTNFYPDYTLVYSKYEQMYLKQKHYTNHDNIMLLGNYNIERRRHSFEKNIQLESIQKNYTKTVGISVQDTIDEKLYNFIYDVTLKNRDILFIWIPRNYDKDYITTENLQIIKDMSCYDIAMNCDIHTTVYSTCAIELLSLGKPIVLINIDNLANHFFSYIENINIANDIEEYSRMLHNNNVENFNKEVISLNYLNNCSRIHKHIQKVLA